MIAKFVSHICFECCKHNAIYEIFRYIARIGRNWRNAFWFLSRYYEHYLFSAE